MPAQALALNVINQLIAIVNRIQILQVPPYTQDVMGATVFLSDKLARSDEARALVRDELRTNRFLAASSYIERHVDLVMHDLPEEIGRAIDERAKQFVLSFCSMN